MRGYRGPSEMARNQLGRTFTIGNAEHFCGPMHVTERDARPSLPISLKTATAGASFRTSNHPRARRTGIRKSAILNAWTRFRRRPRILLFSLLDSLMESGW